jgi:hypothetical protein
MRSSFAICSAATCFSMIDASDAPPRTVKSSPATTMSAAVDAAAPEHEVRRHEPGNRAGFVVRPRRR